MSTEVSIGVLYIIASYRFTAADRRCMNKWGISQDAEQMAKSHSVSTFPPATWETHYGEMKHEP